MPSRASCCPSTSTFCVPVLLVLDTTHHRPYFIYTSIVLLSLRVRTDLTYFLVYFSDFRCPSNSYPSKYHCFRHIQHVILCCRHVTSFSSLSYSRKCYILEEHEHCKDILVKCDAKGPTCGEFDKLNVTDSYTNPNVPTW